MEYTPQIGDAQYPPPYSFPGVTILSFCLEADLRALKELCDKVLNIGARKDRGFEYRPVLPCVFLEILHYPRMQYGGGDPNAAGKAADALSLDYTEQSECYVKLLVMKWVYFDGWPVPDGELAFFCPLLLVNNTWSAFSGRDVMGFPKLFGTFNPPVMDFLAQLKDRGAFIPQASVSTLAFRNYDPNSKATLLPVVAVKKKAEPLAKEIVEIADAAKGWPWGDIGGLLQRYSHFLSEIDVRYDEMVMASVQMKEFRDAGDPARACYQAIIGSSIYVESVDPNPDRSGPLPPVEVTITDYPSLMLAASLGIPSGEPLSPIWQNYYTCNFKFDNVRTLFVNSDTGGFDPGGFWTRFLPYWLPAGLFQVD